ncbi:cyclic GMP-AMP synthase isoform X2 [Ambystoma mexicanum]|uniref:cyclic GMP-AMP synthase isoform X2 n=1 Tax=Ambystoma mexicanum TaxID=8296 RepID=UPI0037E942E7
MGDRPKKDETAWKEKTPGPRSGSTRKKVPSDNSGEQSKKPTGAAKAKAADVPNGRKASSKSKSKPPAILSHSTTGAAKSPVSVRKKDAQDATAGARSKPSKSTGCLPPRGQGASSAVAPPLRAAPPRPKRQNASLQDVASDLRLRAKDVSKAVEEVNPLIDSLIREIQKHPLFSGVERLATGSYYEKVKISKADEFDIMLKMPISRIKLELFGDSGAFYQVSFGRGHAADPLADCVDKSGNLSARMMLEKLRSHIKKTVKCLEGMDISIKRKQSGSPAVTLIIKRPDGDLSVDIVLALEVEKQSWPPSTKHGLAIQRWLGTKVRLGYRFSPFYLVAKSTIDKQKMAADTWRISFSHVEKAILKNHGNSKTCCEKDGQKCCRLSHSNAWLGTASAEMIFKGFIPSLPDEVEEFHESSQICKIHDFVSLIKEKLSETYETFVGTTKKRT